MDEKIVMVKEWYAIRSEIAKKIENKTEEETIRESIDKINICLREKFESISPSLKEIKNVRVCSRDELFKMDCSFTSGGIGRSNGETIYVNRKGIGIPEEKHLDKIIISKGELFKSAESIHKKLILDIERSMIDSVAISFTYEEYPVIVLDEIDEYTISLSTLFYYMIISE